MHILQNTPFSETVCGPGLICSGVNIARYSLENLQSQNLTGMTYRPFSHCIDQAGLGAFTAKSGRKHYNPPPLTVM